MKRHAQQHHEKCPGNFIDLHQHHILTIDPSNDFYKVVVDKRPLSYVAPPFPSLYWPFPFRGVQTNYLYDPYDIFLFTLYWTLICVVGVHLVAAGYACLIQYRNWKVIWIALIVFGIVGGVQAVIAGSIVGGL
jgi:hypothetical protein